MNSGEAERKKRGKQNQRARARLLLAGVPARTVEVDRILKMLKNGQAKQVVERLLTYDAKTAFWILITAEDRILPGNKAHLLMELENE